MKRLLYIQASPRGERSASNMVARSYIDALRKNEEIEVDTLDVWKDSLPAFDGEALDAKYAGLSGTPLTPAQQAAWKAIEALGQRFRDSDEIVISVPMWNFGVPYRLKQLVDLVTQKDVTFLFGENGFDGMLKKQRALLVCARGLAYGEGGLPEEKFDFQKSYLTAWLNFLGIANVRSMSVNKTLLGPDECEASVAKAVAEAGVLAA
ncbi:MAG: NAD(P)H-dependent oxidoreductase [Hyphomicrobium sp.]|jgi:FMN-dependent NADH-azoreductase